MSDASEVKRFYFVPTGEKDFFGKPTFVCDNKSLYGDYWFITVEDHDRIMAELKAEVAQAKREAADAMSGCCDCPMFKAQGKTLTRQARVIEKLKRYTQHRVDCICRAGVFQYSNDCDCGLKAIEHGEGT